MGLKKVNVTYKNGDSMMFEDVVEHFTVDGMFIMEFENGNTVYISLDEISMIKSELLTLKAVINSTF